MTQRTSRALTAIASSGFLLFTLAACPGSEGGTDGGSCASYYDALISYAERCSGCAPASNDQRARFVGFCERNLAAPGAANASGQLASCIGKLNAATCGSDDFDCELTGTLDEGAPCGEGYQCRSGYCKKANDSTCGSCGARGPIGSSCSTDRDCVEGAECNGSTDRKCVAVRLAKAGESCFSGSTETEAVRCAEGLICSTGTSSTERTCKALGKTGDACRFSAECERSLACTDGKCGAGLPEGAACSGFAGCAQGLGCDPSTKKCARLVYVKTGEACDMLVRRCERGSCRGVSFGTETKPGTCVDPLPDGAACNEGDDDAPRCDVFARCVNGKCTVEDPSQCK